jgi:hypothetical protein
MAAMSKRLCHPAFPHSVTAHPGTLPAEYSLFDCDAPVSGIKLAEDGSGDVIVRIYNDDCKERDVKITFANEIQSSCLCSLTEVPGEELKVQGKIVNVPICKKKLVTIRVRRVR